MIRTERLIVGPLATNCYLLWDQETRDAVVIDPGAEGKRIVGRVAALRLNPLAIVLTHAHVDHAGSAGYVARELDAPVFIHKDETQLLNTLALQAQMFDLPEPDPAPDPVLVEDGKTLDVGKSRLKIRHAPGHSPGSICVVDEAGQAVWVGDLIFRGAVGRTDLPGGSYAALVRSIRSVIFSLPDDFILYPGHGEPTTVGEELRWNPIVADMM